MTYKNAEFLAAAEKNDWPVVLAMLEENLELNINEKFEEGKNKGKTVLWLAAKFARETKRSKEWKDIVYVMLNKHKQGEPDINAAPTHEEDPDRGKTVLWLAVAYGDWDIVSLMLNKHGEPDINAAPIYEEDPDRGKTVLWLATFYGSCELVPLLNKHNKHKYGEPDINAAPTHEEDWHRGMTALWLAARRDKQGIVCLMLEKHSRPNINAMPTHRMHFLVDDVAYFEHGKGVVNNSDSGKTVLWLAADNQRWDVVGKIATQYPDADINAAPTRKKNRGKTVLWLAAVYKQWDIVNFEIIKQRFTTNSKANFYAAPTSEEDAFRGISVLSVIACYRNWEMMKRILEYYPTFTIIDNKIESVGISVLSKIASLENENWKKAEYTLRHYSDVDADLSKELESGHKSIGAILEENKQTDIIKLCCQKNWQLFRKILLVLCGGVTPFNLIPKEILANIISYCFNPLYFGKNTKTNFLKMAESTHKIYESCSKKRGIDRNVNSNLLISQFFKNQQNSSNKIYDENNDQPLNKKPRIT